MLWKARFRLYQLLWFFFRTWCLHIFDNKIEMFLGKFYWEERYILGLIQYFDFDWIPYFQLIRWVESLAPNSSDKKISSSAVSNLKVSLQCQILSLWRLQMYRNCRFEIRIHRRSVSVQMLFSTNSMDSIQLSTRSSSCACLCPRDARKKRKAILITCS